MIDRMGAPGGKACAARPEAEVDLRASRIGVASVSGSGVRPTLDRHELEITSLLLDGDHRGAITACAHAYGRAVGRVCFLLLGAQHETDEAAQETMIAAYHAAPSYRAEGTVRAWLLSIARNVCAQRLIVRTRQARRSVLLDPAPLHDESGDASHLHDVAERDAAIRAALAELPTADREILALRFEADQSFRDIAESLAIDEAAARKRVGRALARLRARLSGEEVA
jgi:RNA polymerase sigma-70 factor, ECF subfamily